MIAKQLFKIVIQLVQLLPVVVSIDLYLASNTCNSVHNRNFVRNARHMIDKAAFSSMWAYHCISHDHKLLNGIYRKLPMSQHDHGWAEVNVKILRACNYCNCNWLKFSVLLRNLKWAYLLYAYAYHTMIMVNVQITIIIAMLGGTDMHAASNTVCCSLLLAPMLLTIVSLQACLTWQGFKTKFHFFDSSQWLEY